MEHTRESSITFTPFDEAHLSRSFIDHPWFKESSDFINLEGAGAGGYGASPFFHSLVEPLILFSDVRCCCAQLRHGLRRPGVASRILMLLL